MFIENINEIAVMVGFYILLFIVLNIVLRVIIKRRLGTSEKTAKLYRLSFNISALFLLILFALSLSDISQTNSFTSTFITVLSTSLGVGLSLVIYNFWSSIGLQVQRTCLNFSFVEIAGIKGLIERVGKFQTYLKSIDGYLLVVPNSLLFDKEVKSYKENPVRRLTVKIIVPRGPNIGEFIMKLEENLKNLNMFVKDPVPEVYFTGVHQEGMSEITVFAWFEQSKPWIVLQSMVQSSTLQIIKEMGFGPQSKLTLRVDERESKLLKPIFG